MKPIEFYSGDFTIRTIIDPIESNGRMYGTDVVMTLYDDDGTVLYTTRYDVTNVDLSRSRRIPLLLSVIDEDFIGDAVNTSRVTGRKLVERSDLNEYGETIWSTKKHPGYSRMKPQGLTNAHEWEEYHRNFELGAEHPAEHMVHLRELAKRKRERRSARDPMTRLELLRFALRAVNDWTFVPVLRDALLEHPATSRLLEREIAFAEALAKTERRNYFVTMLPRMLSPTWRKKHFDYPVFGVYEFNPRRHESLIEVVDAISEQLREPIVPVYGARAGGR